MSQPTMGLVFPDLERYNDECNKPWLPKFKRRVQNSVARYEFTTILGGCHPGRCLRGIYPIGDYHARDRPTGRHPARGYSIGVYPK